MKDNKLWIIISGISGFLAVALGAFGAHGLKHYLSPDMIEIFKTGVFYHLIHSSVLLAISLYGVKQFFTSAVFLLAGIILFSFSLYFYALTGIGTFAFITPFGGLSLLGGWLFLIIQGAKS